MTFLSRCSFERWSQVTGVWSQEKSAHYAAADAPSVESRESRVAGETEQTVGSREWRVGPQIAKRIAAVALVTVALAASAFAARPLKVCADPNNLPYSNAKQQGFENGLARILG